jgi:hypothetical protein
LNLADAFVSQDSSWDLLQTVTEDITKTTIRKYQRFFLDPKYIIECAGFRFVWRVWSTVVSGKLIVNAVSQEFVSRRSVAFITECLCEMREGLLGS